MSALTEKQKAEAHREKHLFISGRKIENKTGLLKPLRLSLGLLKRRRWGGTWREWNSPDSHVPELAVTL